MLAPAEGGLGRSGRERRRLSDSTGSSRQGVQRVDLRLATVFLVWLAGCAASEAFSARI